ncbi:MAG: hypothetical protein FWG42_03955 [Clostridiales bacterium]|nr:hypothetical protein [Clostridiales bacterium]
MKIYEVYPEYDKYDICIVDMEACKTVCSFDDHDAMFHFDGSPRLKNWWPRVMVRSKNKMALGDYISCLEGGVIILEETAIGKLESMMGSKEILPLECDFGDYKAVNVMDVLDCIDYKKSKYLLLSEELVDGRPKIMYFEKYAFIEEKLEGYNIFKIVDDKESSIFVNEAFVDCVRLHGITGFKFELVWQS